HFVTPLPFQTITKRPVALEMFTLLRDVDMAHLSLSQKADVLVVAPATANTIAKIAHGMADNLLTSTVLATTAPLVIAPAMDADMWANPITQENVAALRARGAVIVGPASGRLASGRVGAGRLVPVEELIAAIRQTLGRGGPLAGRRVTVTAGGTQEALDPVRHLTNRSSGRMGYALAEAARDAGAAVRLIHAPTGLPAVHGVRMEPVRSAADMEAAVMGAVPETDVLIMAAAPADFRPAQVAAQKIKKGTSGGLTLELERTADIVASVGALPEGRRPRIVVGFAAETEDLLANAAAKLRAKRLDLMVANDVAATDSGFEVDTNRVILLTPDGGEEPLPLMQKFDVAEQIVARVALLWERKEHG
ncbi:MAG: bifunctional phosphopantothenoylcysteine decarboxylase/phosphopantothenate--cysteine ligase CoaBC, partial [Chloroflexi bacterium]|nr:bifunctional phosphopantothenoylcysteine decarboxylase/phosphopantothenate--cysteine ligase CoaBC [Chloroflexota bacterium]